MTFGIETIKDIYTGNLNVFLKEIKRIISDNSYIYSIKSNIDFLNEPEYLFSTEKLILYKYFSQYNKKASFPLDKKNIFLFNLLNIETPDIDYIYPLNS